MKKPLSWIVDKGSLSLTVGEIKGRQCVSIREPGKAVGILLTESERLAMVKSLFRPSDLRVLASGLMEDAAQSFYNLGGYDSKGEA